MWISFELSDMSDTSFCSCMRKGVVNEMKLVLGAENLKVMVKKDLKILRREKVDTGAFFG